MVFTSLEAEVVVNATTGWKIAADVVALASLNTVNLVMVVVIVTAMTIVTDMMTVVVTVMMIVIVTMIVMTTVGGMMTVIDMIAVIEAGIEEIRPQRKRKRKRKQKNSVTRSFSREDFTFKEYDCCPLRPFLP